MKKSLAVALTLFMVISAGCAAKPKRGVMFSDGPFKSWDGPAPAFDGPTYRVKPNRVPDGMFGAWIGDAEKRLRVFFAQKPVEKGTSCLITVNNDGTVSDLKIEKSSGSTTVDGKTLEFVKECGPFLPFPHIPDIKSPQVFLIEFEEAPTIWVTRKRD